MTPKLTPGRRVRNAMNDALKRAGTDMQWDEAELEMIARAADAADRGERLRQLWDAEVSGQGRAKELARLSTEIRQLDRLVVTFMARSTDSHHRSRNDMSSPPRRGTNATDESGSSMAYTKQPLTNGEDGRNLYAELLEVEEQKFARRGGQRRILVATPRGGRDVKTTTEPPPLLANLRADRPVEVSDWQLPGWARPNGVVIERRVRVHPDGRVETLY